MGDKRSMVEEINVMPPIRKAKERQVVVEQQYLPSKKDNANIRQMLPEKGSACGYTDTFTDQALVSNYQGIGGNKHKTYKSNSNNHIIISPYITMI